MRATPARASWPATAQLGRPGEEIDEAHGRYHEKGLQHLGDEARADERHGKHEPPRPAVFDRPCGRVGCRGQQQHKQRVRVVVTEHQGSDGGKGDHSTGDEASRRAEPPLYSRVEFRRWRHPPAPEG